MAYWGFENLHGRTTSDKVLYDKAFDTEINPECKGYQRANIFWQRVNYDWIKSINN